MARNLYPREKLEVLKLTSKQAIPYLHALWTWLLTLRPFWCFGETGHTVDGIVGWMFFHNFSLVGTTSKYGSHVLVDATTADILGVASLVPDDRGVGAELVEAFPGKAKPTGFWGGVYIKDHAQRSGLGRYLCEFLDTEVQTRVNSTGEEEEWYLFTRNPHAATIYTALGFEEFAADWHIKIFDVHETVYKKVYRRQA